MNDDEFNQVITDLAKHYRQNPVFDLRVLADIARAGSPARIETIYQEIETGILVRQQRVSGPPSFKPKRLPLVFGLGMLLADEVRSISTTKSPEDLDEWIQRWFEPHSDSDLQVEICGSGLFHAFIDESFPFSGKRAILKQWLTSRNWGDEAQSAFIDYIIRGPAEFVAVAEEIWASGVSYGAAQQFLATAFLKYQGHNEVERVLVPAVGRWMSFVHLASHPMRRHTPEKDILRRQEITEKIGTHKPGDTVQVEAVNLHIVEEDGLLNLTRLGLLIMSNGASTEFLSALVPWAVAGAVMDYHNATEVAAWVVRLSEHDCEGLLLPQIHLLLRRKSPIALSAARTLLWILGTPLARQERSRLPEPEFVVKGRQEHSKDPCHSFHEWSDEDCLQCLECTTLNPMVIVERVGDRIFAPNYPVPNSLSLRCFDLVRSADPKAIFTGLSASIESHAFEVLTPILASRRPNLLADLVREFVSTMKTRDLDGLRGLAYHLPMWAPLFRTAEMQTILAIALKLWKDGHNWTPIGKGHSTIGQTIDLFVLPVLLSAADPVQQLELMENRPPASLDREVLEVWFEPLPKNLAQDAHNRLRQLASEEIINRALWFLASSKACLTELDVDFMLELVQRDNAILRGTVMRFACITENQKLGKRIVDLALPSLPSRGWWEENWSAKITIQFGGHLRFDDAIHRVHLLVAGNLLGARGNKAEEILHYAALIDVAWTEIIGAQEPALKSLPPIVVPVGANLSGLDRVRMMHDSDASVSFRGPSSTWFSARPQPTAEDLKRALDPNAETRINQQTLERTETLNEAWRTAALNWYGRQFCYAALEQIYRIAPHYFDRWISPALESTELRWLNRTGAFVSQLCEIVLKDGDLRGETLWKKMRSRGSSPIVLDTESLAFTALHEFGRNVLLDEAHDDATLSRMALRADKFGRMAWFDASVARLVDGCALWRKAKGLTMASFSNIGIDEFEALIAKASVQDTWVADQLPWLRKNVKLNVLAQYWYERFCNESDRDRTWAAFQMVLATGDTRFCLWYSKRIPPDSKRAKYIEANYESISQILDKKKDREKTLFGVPIPKGEITPFLD